ncbi:MAG: hypothetical protein P0Y53_06595 [Candidatus Pseudobacter hemicellulosilyticus]|uniref:Uncharacterized protein n=1 Tax=Candidatus Pseudobacter hemicellulosilyticus TaxID=3121375 RepID=A0AAJ5WTM3_9BACT|nr:MAG: hypothetical protein P0Y53_06595 [Pseudobacter sp.]
MYPSLVILGITFTIGVTEMLVFLFGAIVLGFFIHFFLVHRRSLPRNLGEPSVIAQSAIDPDEWKLKYHEEMEVQEKAQKQLRRELAEAQENEELLSLELTELKKELAQLQEEKEALDQQPATYFGQLKMAQDNLQEHNQNIARLLEQIETLKESDKRHAEIRQANELLSAQVRELRRTSFDQEALIRQLRQEQFLEGEMKDRLLNTQEAFNALQDKLLKMETYLAHPEHRQFEYDELQENYFKITKEYDEVRMKQLTLLEENQRMLRLIADTEDKLRESNFQRQQLMKKVGFLEELNRDLQQVTEQNKKLEIQLKRITEIESLLARAAEQRRSEKGNIG